MNEIVVVSGKGGTGKTSLTAALASLASQETVVADCDVDAANMHLLLQPDIKHQEDFYSGLEAHLDSEICIECGNCQEACHFEAINNNEQGYHILPHSCEGCGFCARVCPVGAITMKEPLTGKVFISQTPKKNTLIHARLEIGAENSGKLVTHVKTLAKKQTEKEGKEFLIVDGTPGIGCPVIASLSGANLVVMVTEPTISGLHDMKRIHQLVKRFGIRAGCVINKEDLNPEKTQEIKDYLCENQIALLGTLPFDEAFINAMVKGVTIQEYAPSYKPTIEGIWEKMKESITQKPKPALA